MNARMTVKSVSLALALTVGGVYAAAQNPPVETDGDRIRGNESQEHRGSEERVNSRNENAEQGSKNAEDGSENAASGNKNAERVIQNWKPETQKLAKQLIEKYGEPQEVTAERLIWHNNGPWQQTELVNEEIVHNFPTRHTDVLKQTIYMKVPNDKLVALAEYDGSVIVDRTSGRISARCGQEEMNFLALNLAHDVISGKKSAAEARDIYNQNVTAFKAGQKDPYTQKFHFEPTRVGEAITPDKSVTATEKTPVASLDK